MREDNKKIDGIKKLDKEEMKKSRKVVLETIGEGVKPPLASLPPSPSKNLDSAKKTPLKKSVDLESQILPIPNNQEKKAVEKKPDKIAADQPLSAKEIAERKKWREEISVILNPKEKMESQGQSQGFLSRKEDVADNFVKSPLELAAVDSVKRKEKVISKPTLPQNKAFDSPPVSPGKSQESRKNIYQRKTTDEEKIRGIKDKQIAEKAKREAKSKKILERIKRNKEKEERRREDSKARQKRWENRLKKYRKLKDKYKKKKKNLVNYHKLITIQVLLISFSSFFIFLLFYAIFAIVVVETGADNVFLRSISARLPVPAYITSNGIVEFYKYQDIKKELASQYQNVEELEQVVKLTIIEKALLEGLVASHNLAAFGHSQDTAVREDLARRLVFDHEINQAGIERIKKIKQLMDGGEDFEKIATTYGDGQGELTINAFNEGLYEFSDDLRQLEVGDISNIVYAPDGYYIFKLYSETDDYIALSYVFIKAKTLDEYLLEATQNYKMWSWVD